MPRPANAAGEEEYATRAGARGSLFESSEVSDNRERRHSAQGSVAPAQFEGNEYSQLTVRFPVGEYKFFRWAARDGQQLLPALKYAPLPDALVARVDAELAAVEFTD